MPNNPIKNLETLAGRIKMTTDQKQGAEDFLMAKISERLVNEKQNKVSVWVRLADSFVPSYSLQPVAVFGLILALVLVSSFGSVSASKNALPGDTLYPVKLTAENLKYSLTFSGEKKAKLAMSLVEERINELKIVVDLEDNNKQEKIASASESIKNTLAKVKDRVEEINRTAGGDKNILATTQEIDKKLAVASAEINKTAAKMDEKTKDKLAGVASQIESASTVVLTVLIDQQGGAEETISPEALRERVKIMIDRLTQEIASLKITNENYQLIIDAQKDLKEIEFNFRGGDYKLALENIQKVRQSLYGEVQGESDIKNDKGETLPTTTPELIQEMEKDINNPTSTGPTLSDKQMLGIEEQETEMQEFGVGLK